MSRKWFLSTVTFLLTAGLLLLLYSSREVEPRARVWPLNLVVNDPLNYADKTFADSATAPHSWRWEFGQGNSSLAMRGTFKYPHPGTYKVRLTLDGKYERLFTVVVRPAAPRDTVIRLLGPRQGYVGEKLTFQAYGAAANKYTWKFGDKTITTASEATVFHTYTKPLERPAKYVVELETDVTSRPLRHVVVVQPQYSRFVAAQAPDTVADDIRTRLQRIANGRQVNQQYSYLLNRYLCGQADAQVLAGEQPPSDFYSYCMNLQFDPDWVIDAVEVQVDSTRTAQGKATGRCSAKLVVTQHKRD